MDGITMGRQYLIKPKLMGSLFLSSKYVAIRMMEQIDFGNANTIVEYNPGIGLLTEKLVQAMRPETILLLFEHNLKNYKILHEKFKNEPNIIIINDSIEHMGRYMATYQIPWVDYIVSGLPFTSMPYYTVINILELTQTHLRQGGYLVTLQYNLWSKTLIENYFNKVYIRRELKNIPPAYIFYCTND